MYADHTSLSLSGIDIEQLTEELCTAQNRAEKWFKVNKSFLNKDKTNSIFFSLRDTADLTNDLNTVIFVGVQLDSRLI